MSKQGLIDLCLITLGFSVLVYLNLLRDKIYRKGGFLDGQKEDEKKANKEDKKDNEVNF